MFALIRQKGWFGSHGVLVVQKRVKKQLFEQSFIEKKTQLKALNNWNIKMTVCCTNARSIIIISMTKGGVQNIYMGVSYVLLTSGKYGRKD